VLKAENLSLQRAGKNIISHIDLVVPAGQVMILLILSKRFLTQW